MAEELAYHGYDISPGTLYPTLHRLEADGLLVSEQQVVDGRVRRVYTATEAGPKALAELAREVPGQRRSIGPTRCGVRSPHTALRTPQPPAPALPHPTPRTSRAG
ncbi:PadR family transcriptional regulator [Streptomyces sp. NPDC003393]